MLLYRNGFGADRRFAVVNSNRVSESARIEASVLNALTPIAKSEIAKILPDVSPSTIAASRL